MSKQKKDPGMGISVDLEQESTEATEEVASPAAETEVAAPEPQTVAPPRTRRVIEAPYCPIHKTPMRSYCSVQMYTYYRCTTEGCRETAKKVRPIMPLKDKYGHGKSSR